MLLSVLMIVDSLPIVRFGMASLVHGLQAVVAAIPIMG